jgi:hypothetical protein
LSKGENIVKWIKGQRISWLGHVERMEEDRMPKKIFTQELEGTRRRRRPRKRWEEEVERDVQVLGVRRWRELVADRRKMEGHCSTGQSLQWAVVPMGEEQEGTRRRGRPRKGWEEEEERDLQVLGVRRWRELVADRKKWKDSVRQAKAHSGL